ncbi:unnamed protein product [Coffea canephora]|uniref:Protein kinase domain-containing protein n=1 Tax=Coffea canephora TaxID=49390 RepID=A0A068UT23_COFCA|nr:unnamed protein product [Coffea canephora]
MYKNTLFGPILLSATDLVYFQLAGSKINLFDLSDFILRGGRRVPLYRLFSKPSFLFGILLLMADIENKLIIPITKLCGLAEYTILRKEEGSLYQGKIQRFGKDHGDVSFLLFQSEEEVSNIVKNLEKFTGEEFLVVKDVIKDSTNDCYWLIVEYVTSLTKIQETKAVWSKKRLELPYRQILRDMIIGFHKLHEKKTPHGPISASQIYIGLGGHGKLAHICGNAENWDEQLRSIDVAGLRELFRQILGSNAENEELVHFQKRFLDRQMSNPAVVVEKLFYHPLLMSDVERFYMPLITNTNLRHGTGFPSTADAAQAFDWSFKPLDEDWSKAVPWRGAYRLVYRKGNYGTGMWSRFCYTRNCTQHITDDDISTELRNQGRPTMRGSTGAIARDLSSFFEGHLLYVYDFFSLADFKSC